MKARTLYPLIALVPATVSATCVAMSVAAFAWGILWLAIYGDDPWPDGVDTVVGLIAGLVFSAAMGVQLWAAHRYGLRRDEMLGRR